MYTTPYFNRIEHTLAYVALLRVLSVMYKVLDELINCRLLRVQEFVIDGLGEGKFVGVVRAGSGTLVTALVNRTIFFNALCKLVVVALTICVTTAFSLDHINAVDAAARIAAV